MPELQNLQPGRPHCRWRLGVVSYLNAKPLIQGLEGDPNLELLFDVPARLPTLLDEGAVDIALVPVIDLVRSSRHWRIISDACIGCDGETLTVRVFSRVPPDAIRTLHVDGDSHTSACLASILWREYFGRSLELFPLAGAQSPDECEAVLLIGDKVVANTLIDHDIQTDLGQVWKSLTGLPFVFAVWAAPADFETAQLGEILSKARDAGVRSAAMIAADFGPGMGWPVALAERYLTARLNFTLGRRERLGMSKFFELAGKHRLITMVKEPVFA